MNARMFWGSHLGKLESFSPQRNLGQFRIRERGCGYISDSLGHAHILRNVAENWNNLKMIPVGSNGAYRVVDLKGNRHATSDFYISSIFYSIFPDQPEKLKKSA